MDEVTEKSKFRLRLLIDEKRNKVVLAEACRDFVDVLFSFLTLPMGTIVRLFDKHQKLQPVSVGCFNNLYKSVTDMAVDDFETEACKSMLLYPRSSKEIHCRRLKLNIDDTEATKFFTCQYFNRRESCRQYINFNTSRCSCGDSMTRQVQVPEKEQIGGQIGDAEDGVFVKCRSSYIVTDDLRVTLSSLGVIANVLNGLGYADFDDLQEILLDVGFEEVMTLLENIFASEFPLTCTFLSKPFMARREKRLSTHTPKMEHAKGSDECCVKLFVRKFDRKILYAECSEDFVDALLTFLVLPLELALSLSNDDSTILGCVANLCRSECRRALASTSCDIPYYYTCSKQILDIPTQPAVEYKISPPFTSVIKLVRQIEKPSTSIIPMRPRDPKVKPDTPSIYGTGFVKRDTKFIVSDDLVITPMKSASTIGLFMKSNININDLEEHGISISKAELISILRASLISRSALTNGLSSVLAKKRKKQVLCNV